MLQELAAVALVNLLERIMMACFAAKSAAVPIVLRSLACMRIFGPQDVQGDFARNNSPQIQEKQRLAFYGFVLSR